jgi:predicted nucleic acid binding AN1-type Zn finger protein
MTSNKYLEPIINTENGKLQFYKNVSIDCVLPENSNYMISDKNITVSENNIKQKSKKRCNYDTCKTKLGLIPFECRCLMNYCPEHRLPENHQCSFDYKNFGKSLIEKNNQKVIGEKIQKI